MSGGGDTLMRRSRHSAVFDFVCLPMKQLACWQLVAGCLWMAACAYVNCISQVYVDKFQDQRYHDRTPELLTDLGFYFLSYIEIPHLADYWNVVIVVFTLLPVLLFHPNRLKVILRFLAIQGSVFFFRSATIIVTLLPPPNKHCVNLTNPDENIFIEAAKLISGLRFTCGDTIFSGHAANFTLMALIWSEYGYGFLAVDESARGYSALGSSRRGQIGGRHRGGPVLHFIFRRLMPLLWWIAAITGTPRASAVGGRTLSIEMQPIQEFPDLEAMEAGTNSPESSASKQPSGSEAGPSLYGRSRSGRFNSDFTDIDDTFVIEDSFSRVLYVLLFAPQYNSGSWDSFILGPPKRVDTVGHGEANFMDLGRLLIGRVGIENVSRERVSPACTWSVVHSYRGRPGCTNPSTDIKNAIVGGALVGSAKSQPPISGGGDTLMRRSRHSAVFDFVCLPMKQLACWQLVAGCLWMAACAYVNCISQIYVDKFQNEHYHGRTPELLPDLGFYFLPHIEVPHLADYWNVAIVVSTMLPVVLFHPKRRKVILRFLAIQGSVFLLRSATIIVTLLPPPYQLCVNVSSPDENVFLEAAKIVLGVRFTCGDILFSGHAANFTLMALIWSEYGYGFLAVDESARGYSALGSSRRGQIGGRHRGGPVLHFIFRRLMPLLWWIAAITGTPRASAVGGRTLSIEMQPIQEFPDLEAMEAGTNSPENSASKQPSGSEAGPSLYGRSRSGRFNSDFTDIDDTFVIEDSSAVVQQIRELRRVKKILVGGFSEAMSSDEARSTLLQAEKILRQWEAIIEIDDLWTKLVIAKLTAFIIYIITYLTQELQHCHTPYLDPPKSNPIKNTDNLLSACKARVIEVAKGFIGDNPYLSAAVNSELREASVFLNGQPLTAVPWGPDISSASMEIRRAFIAEASLFTLAVASLPFGDEQWKELCISHKKLEEPILFWCLPEECLSENKVHIRLDQTPSRKGSVFVEEFVRFEVEVEVHGKPFAWQTDADFEAFLNEELKHRANTDPGLQQAGIGYLTAAHIAVHDLKSLRITPDIVLDLSRNQLADRAASHLCLLLQKLQRTLKVLNLSNNPGLTAATAISLAKCAAEGFASEELTVCETYESMDEECTRSGSEGKPMTARPLEFIDLTGCSIDEEQTESAINKVLNVAADEPRAPYRRTRDEKLLNHTPAPMIALETINNHIHRVFAKEAQVKYKFVDTG
ncbi:hypothetical protein FOL47_009665 [Perkinsus chesapeaki]|uniref:Uncharacterized protein n=1 Tax=Perkinsus chesapeaki TaxID=330153 RepID=A0A7J6MR98_PERCH|nr:hypothetical protein FOL47_009665 [Perkinsus chesapeaki]